MTTRSSLMPEDDRTGVSRDTAPTGNIECHHVPFTLNFVLSGMILVHQPIGLAL